MKRKIDEDVLSAAYQYAWGQGSQIKLEDFLRKYKPSMVQDDGTKPWLWVRKSESPSSDNKIAAVEEAWEYVNDISCKVEEIKNDASIPTRSNKKTGVKSKKELREELQAAATEKLKEISQRHGYVCGKWLIFAPPDRIDSIWLNLATSLVSGPLSLTAAFLAKVSTCPSSGEPPAQHLICVYMPDIYDQTAVTEVMKVLLRNHGLNLTGVKSDLYTSIGLDSKHASGIKSTVWANTALMKDSEIKELKQGFYDNPPDTGKSDLTAATTSAPAQDLAPPVKNKLQAKKKVQDDPFVSGDDDEEQVSADKPLVEVPAKSKLKLKLKKVVDDPFTSDNEDDTPAAKPAKRPSSQAKRTKPVDDDDDEEAKPSKKKR